MSGGAFDRAYFDAEQLAQTIEEMEAEMDRADYPDEVVTRLSDLRSHLESERDLLRTVEWVASGDYGTDKLDEI